MVQTRQNNLKFLHLIHLIHLLNLNTDDQVPVPSLSVIKLKTGINLLANKLKRDFIE